MIHTFSNRLDYLNQFTNELPSRVYGTSLTTRRVLESTAIIVGAPLIGYAIAGDDPFLVEASFPWLVLGPLLIGGQHGLVPAMICSGLWISAAWLEGVAAQQAFGAWSFGCIAVAAIAGLLHDRWFTHKQALNGKVNELGERLERLGRTHAVLVLSHQRLEERVAAERWSIQSVIADAERQIVKLESFSQRAQLLLNLLSAHAFVQVASVYQCEKDGTSRTAAAVLGRASPLAWRSSMVQRALRNRTLVAVSGDTPASHEDAVLAAVPLVTSSQRVFGIIAVQQMPFIAFNQEQLDQLAVLTGKFADLMEAAENSLFWSRQHVAATTLERNKKPSRQQALPLEATEALANLPLLKIDQPARVAHSTIRNDIPAIAPEPRRAYERVRVFYEPRS